LICGLLGLPPSNGVLPQAPMHTKSLAVLNRQVRTNTYIYMRRRRRVETEMMIYFLQLIRKKMVKKAKECMKMKASKSEIYGRMQSVFIEMETSPPQVSNNAFSYIYRKKLFEIKEKKEP